MPHRVFLGLTEVAGYFGSLRRGFEEVGIPAVFVDESADPFGYGLASQPFRRLNRAVLSVNRRLASPSVRGVERLAWQLAAVVLRPLKLAYRLALLTWAVARCDVFIFGGAYSFLPGHRDLALLRRLGKRVIWIFTGSDHRPPYLNGRIAREAERAGGAAWLARLTAATAARVTAIEAHAMVVGNAASAQFHQRPFVSFLAVGVPMWRDFPPPQRIGSRSGPVRVLHSPSDPISKGTATIREIIDRLRKRGLDIDYREVVGRPNAEVLNAIAECDLVMDELYSDSPMAVLACEAAHLERPAVVGGYYAAYLDQLPPDARPPTAFVTPEDVESTLAALVADAAARHELGTRARAFVEDSWARGEIARRLLLLADGHAPEAWFVDPAEVRYVHGWGMSERQLAHGVAEFVRSQGRAALRLGHNPDLEDRLIALATSAGEMALPSPA